MAYLSIYYTFKGNYSSADDVISIYVQVRDVVIGICFESHEMLVIGYLVIS